MLKPCAGADSKTVLTKNAARWDVPKHNLDRIEFTPIASPSTRVAALLSGGIDLIDSVPLQDMKRLESTPNINVEQRPDLRTINLAFNRKEKLADGRDNFFNDLRVRQAFDHAIDRELLAKRIMRGMTHTAGTVVSPEIPGYTKELDIPTKYDPKLSKKLLDEAGATGSQFNYLCMNEENVCSVIVTMLSRVGLKPKLDIAPRAVQAPKRSSGKSDMFMIGWANELTLDAYSILVQVIATCKGAAGVANYGGWSYPELDALVEKAALEMDRAKRLAIEAEALAIVKSEVIMIPLHQQPMAWGMTANIADVTIRADNKPRHWLTRMIKYH